jgi:cobalt-precorrin-5B (C1)-methyltransferase
VITFLRGEGVGIVTQPGLQAAIGEPAINPIPRQMMINAVHEVLGESDQQANPGFDLEIGCINGEQIARRTFNPRLGIEGGISILGTTGIVEPKSKAAFQASVEVYIRVALGHRPDEIVLAPGNLGQRFARDRLGVSPKQVVQMSNFIGFALDGVERTLSEMEYRLPVLWLVGHPGKLAKILSGDWDTHSGKSAGGIQSISQLAREYGLPAGALDVLARCKSVEEAIEIISPEILSPLFWKFVEMKIATVAATRLSRVERRQVRLFRMNGESLSELNRNRDERNLK